MPRLFLALRGGRDFKLPDLTGEQKAGQAALAPSLPGAGLCKKGHLVRFFWFDFVFWSVRWRQRRTKYPFLHSTQYQSKERGRTALPGRHSH